MPLPLPSLPLTISPTITLVTCLYDIDRETKGDGRKFEDYINWFSKTLELEENMVIFVDKSLQQFVEEKRSHLKDKTKIMIRPFLDLSAYKHLNKIKEILSNLKFQATDLSLKLPEYEVVIHSKAGLIEEVILQNHFNTSLFGWIDAGVSRFWKKVSPKEQWPHPDYRKLIEKSNRVWIQAHALCKKEIHQERHRQFKGTSLCHGLHRKSRRDDSLVWFAESFFRGENA